MFDALNCTHLKASLGCSLDSGHPGDTFKYLRCHLSTRSFGDRYHLLRDIFHVIFVPCSQFLTKMDHFTFENVYFPAT